MKTLKQKLSLLFVVGAAILLIAGMFTGKIFFIPTSPSPDILEDPDVVLTRVQGDDVIGTTASIERFFNSRNEGYTIKLMYQVNPMTNTDELVILVSYHKKFFMPENPNEATGVEIRKMLNEQKRSNEEMRRKLGEILYISNILMDTWDVTLILNDMRSDNPTGAFWVYRMDHFNVLLFEEEMTPETISEWTKYTVRKAGTIATPNTGPAFIPEDAVPIPDR